MPTIVDVVIALSEVFARLQLRYAVGGALANNYWGIVRATEDVDCLITLPAIQYQQFADELNHIDCTIISAAGNSAAVTVPNLREQVKQRGLMEFYSRLLDPPARIELFVPMIPLQNEILRRAIPVYVRGRPIPITTAEDLILLKLAFHRAKDLQDVRGILYVQRGKLDIEYVRHWSAEMLEQDVANELEQLIKQYFSYEGTESRE
ncbi:MAG TPA: hypothetical protein VFW73_05620 [Lacipirellulaceae bacterium]|nr:hypothetical protein [Lacipirellulaceae bacterium]